METAPLSPAEKSALLGLLDDPSPAVRRALLAHFTALGPAVAPFLQEITRAPNRLLARHAAWFLEELKFTDPVAEFRAFIRSLHYELETGALLLARTVNPRLDVGACCAQLDAIAARCTELIAEPATQVAELQAGRLDIATTIPLSMLPVVANDPKLRTASINGPTTLALRFNTRDGITKDANVRRALVMAVDRDAIVKQILGGNAEPVASFQGKLSFGFDPDLKPRPFDVAQAKTLLQQAGVKPGTAVQIDFRGPDSNFREVVQAVAGYFQAVGLKPNLKGYETSVLLNDIIPSGKTGEMWQNQWGGWTFDYDNTAYAMYHSGQRWNPYDSDPNLDKLLDAQRNTYDQAERQRLLREAARYVADQALEIPLYSLNTIYGINKRVKNLTLPADGRFRFVNETIE